MKPKQEGSRKSTRVKILEATMDSPRARKPVIRKTTTISPKKKAATSSSSSSPKPRAVKKTSPTKKKVATKRAPKKSSPMTYEGVPQTALPDGQPWPAGWKERRFQRLSGSTKGTEDKYYYAPKNEEKFRSIAEVTRYIKALNETKDEAVALSRAKGGKGKQSTPTKKLTKRQAAAAVAKESSPTKKRAKKEDKVTIEEEGEPKEETETEKQEEAPAAEGASKEVEKAE